MSERMKADRRLLGFNTGDWAMLFGSLILIGLITLLVVSFRG